MPIVRGTRLGPYEILGPLGAGGMGEVHRARDTRLGRDVAVKVLPAGLADHPERRARFEREAKTVSALNHPHICVLHDVGREGDVDYLVMELVEGETLAQRLGRGALPPNEVLKIGGEIADALDRAHRAGVVHRDLKPGNVMLTRSGAKLLDFGLARTTGPAAPAGGLTVTAQPLTAEGTIVGTFQYMAPEQLEGREADARADLWALGCVLYEMATGRRPFEGASQASLIGAIMRAEPRPLSTLAPLSPPALDRLVGACLAKDPADRVQSAHDVKLQLAWIAAGTTAAAAPVAAPRGRRWIALTLVAAASAAATALVFVLLPRGSPGTPALPQRYVVGTAELVGQSAPMLSPDSTYIVYSARDGTSSRLYRRPLSSIEATPIPGTEEAQAPFFSPDGAWIGFATRDAVKKVPAGGGAAQLIVAEPGVNSADWGDDGLIYFTPRAGGRDGNTVLARVRDTGGEPEIVASLDTAAREYTAWLPEILPGRAGVLITINGGSGSWHIVAVKPDGSRHTVVENALLGRYVAPGHLLYFDFDSQALLAAPFDPVKAQVTGPAVPLTEPIDANYCYDVARDGKLVYVPARRAGEGDEIVWLDRQGAATRALDTLAPWASPRLSPDGRRILVRKIGTNCELWMVDVERESLARLVHGDDNHDPVWSPDGQAIVFRRDNADEMVTLRLDGMRETRTIARGAEAGVPCSWSAGGNLLAYVLDRPGRRGDIWVVAMDGSLRPAAFLATEYDERDPALSPDGKWIAYSSDESGSPEVYIRAYPDTGAAWPVSTDGGTRPVWSRDGRELFFVSGTHMMAAPIESHPALRVGAPRVLFDDGFNSGRPARDFDVGPDGRFVAVRAVGGASVRQELRVLLNWQAEMKRTTGAAH